MVRNKLLILFKYHCVGRVSTHTLRRFLIFNCVVIVLSHFFAVFVVDTGKQCFIWVGEKASVDERRKAMQYAHVSRPIYI